MVDVTILPSEEIPSQITARHVIRSLGEHWDAFLAANNISGWQQDDDYVLRDDRIADLLLIISATSGLYLGQFKRMAMRVKVLSQESGNKLPISVINEFLAKALGYYSYNFAYKCRTTDDFIENVWPTGEALSFTELDAEAADVSRHLKTKNRLMERFKLNIRRDRLANEHRALKAGRREKLTAQHHLPLLFR
ncbi:hypothetical protein ABH908_000214 [Pseudomonas frederiksbergensis]|jgi:hypothetical protein|uniref:hypothetical protein n=1 Tax=Pseudomonas TaxID=286 RepID=UPI003D1D5DEB